MTTPIIEGSNLYNIRRYQPRDQDEPPPFDPGWAGEDEAPAVPDGPSIIFYGDEEPKVPPYLVKDVLPQRQVAVIAGQHSAGKTFVGIDLSLSVMTGEPFMGHEVERTGAVLWLAAEGADEVMIRLKAAAVHRFGEDRIGKLPFAQQRTDLPALMSTDALPRLMRLVNDMKAVLATRFPDVAIALVVVDTLNSAAGFQDENSAAETQRAMNVLRRLSNASDALVCVIDHYGKATETGIRGSSAKAGAADAILASLADKDEITGKITSRRVAVVKLRGAQTGEVVPFSLVPVPIDTWGNTHCGIAWSDASGSVPTMAAEKPAKSPWSGSLRVFKDAIERSLLDFGKMMRPHADGPEVKAVPLEKVRAEFYAITPADSQDARQKAFKRALDKTIQNKLVASRFMAGADHLWLVVEP